MEQPIVHVGIDVSKNALDVDPFDGKRPQVPNTKAGIRRLIQRIKAFEHPVTVCCESSGGYEQLLVTMMLEAGVGIARVNAKRVRDYARSQGILAKTDAIDAHVISLYSRSSGPRLLSAPPPWLARMQGLLIRRSDLLEMILQEKNRLAPALNKEIASLVRAHVKTMSSQVARIEELLLSLVREHPELEWGYKRLCAIKSIGMVSALSLLAFLPELGTVSDNEAAALAGLAPYNRDSGMLKGRRMIQGGRTRIRTPLYMAALSAKTYNEVWAELYSRMVRRGKPHKVALTAIMRKMVVLANRLMADPDFQLS